MSTSLLVTDGASESGATPPRPSTLPIVHFDAAATPTASTERPPRLLVSQQSEHMNSLITVSLTPLPDTQTALSSLPSSLPKELVFVRETCATDGGVDAATAGGVRSGVAAENVAELPPTPHFYPSASVCSNDLNQLLRTHTPLSSPSPRNRNDGPVNNSFPQTRVTDRSTGAVPAAAYGESANRDEDASLTNYSNARPDSELTTDPLASMLHSITVVPSSSRALAADSPQNDGNNHNGSGNSETDRNDTLVEQASRGNLAKEENAQISTSAGAAAPLLDAPMARRTLVDRVLAGPLLSSGDAEVNGGDLEGAKESCTEVHTTGATSTPDRTSAQETPLLSSTATSPSLKTVRAATTTGASLVIAPTSTAPVATAVATCASSTSAAAAVAAAPSSPSPLSPPPRPSSAPMPLPIGTASSSGGQVALTGPSSPLPAPRLASLKPASRITTWIRSRVSQNKIRYRDGGFNLDLTYITPHIIAMGYPAHGTEYYIRNPIDEVEHFFDERHKGHYRIYNLCSERAYDSPQRFHGCFRRFPFDDHNAPALSLILQFVRDATNFLDEDAANVVAVHCKAGKGRTGIMVSCLLFYLNPDKFATANDAIHFFDGQRTNDGAGLTIPSQRRYVHYFERILHDLNGALPPVQRRLAIKEVMIRVARESTIMHAGDLYFIVSDHQQMLLDSRMWFPRGPTVSSAGCVFSFATLADGAVPAPLVGDIKFSFFRRRPIVLSGKESTACYLWFNTTLCPTLQMVFQRTELDKVDVAAVGKTVMVSLAFAEVTDGGAQGSASDKPSA